MTEKDINVRDVWQDKDVEHRKRVAALMFGVSEFSKSNFAREAGCSD
jgi:hypothetical protein